MLDGGIKKEDYFIGNYNQHGLHACCPRQQMTPWDQTSGVLALRLFC
jgi:hypothetical protein